MSLLLQSISSFLVMTIGITLPLDQLTYLVGMYMSLGGAYFFKNILQHSKMSLNYKLYSISLLGLWVYYTIWGRLVALPLLQVLVAYIMLQIIPIQKSPKYLFGFSMFFLSMCHIYIVYDYMIELNQDTSADFTGPIMIITLRISALGFNLQDGLTKKDSELNEDQKKYALRKMPTFAEYFAYMFGFSGIICGPFSFYNDVMPWIKKEKLYPAKNKDSQPSIYPPSSRKAVFSKVFLSMVFIFLYYIGTNSYPHEKSYDSDFIANTSVWNRLIFVYLSLLAARCKYYGAWLFADGVHNAAGIGFNGYSEDGSPRWDLVSNINALNTEFATGLKSYIDNWNLMTVKWIRYVCYDRSSPKYRTILSFFVSAFWHGFFPGYYIMFVTSFVFLSVQRKVRRLVRPHFQTSTSARYFYDFVTFLATQLAIAYGAQSFITLEWEGSMKFYKSWWFSGHVIGVVLLLALPNTKPKRPVQPENGSLHLNGDTVTKNPVQESKNASHQNGHVRARQTGL